MARRFILVAVAAAFAALSPATASAVTAPGAPTLVNPTTPYVPRVAIQWNPVPVTTDPTNLSQAVYRATGACGDTPIAGAALVASFPLDDTADTYTEPAAPKLADGTYCYYIEVTGLAVPPASAPTADSPGLEVTVDTTPPTATVKVSNETPGGLVAATVTVSGTSSDPGTGSGDGSGVASGDFYVVSGSGNCRAGTQIGSMGSSSSGSASWDTTEYANGAYTVCTVVTDNAGIGTVAQIAVTVDNPVAPPPAPPVTTTPPATKGPLKPPPAPTKITIVLPRSKQVSATVPVTIRWVNPTVSDLDRVVVVLNRSRAPRTPGDGRVIYHGLKTSAVVSMRPGQLAYVALYAYDKSGVVSKPARKTVSLAALVPLRPLTGSTLTNAPFLTWTAKKGTAYYNVQIFRKGKRVLVGWPTTNSFRVPASKLQPGTYTWFVWPAIEHANAPATFAKQLGHATFKYAPS